MGDKVHCKDKKPWRGARLCQREPKDCINKYLSKGCINKHIFKDIIIRYISKTQEKYLSIMALTNIFPRTSSTNIFSKILSLDIFQKGMKIYILNDGMNKYLSKDCINNIFSKISTFDIFQKGMTNIFQMMTSTNNSPDKHQQIQNKYPTNTSSQ